MKKTNLIIFTLLILIVALGTAIYLKETPVSDEQIVNIPHHLRRFNRLKNRSSTIPFLMSLLRPKKKNNSLQKQISPIMFQNYRYRFQR